MHFKARSRSRYGGFSEAVVQPAAARAQQHRASMSFGTDYPSAQRAASTHLSLPSISLPQGEAAWPLMLGHSSRGS